MANTTHIEYKDKGFWIGEAEMEMIFYFILKAFNKLDPNIDFKDILRDDLEAKASSGNYGYLVLVWPYYIKNEEHELQMAEIIEEAIRNIQDFGEYIPTSALKEAAAYNPLVEHRTVYEKPLETKKVLEVLNALVAMLKGEWEHEDLYLAFDDYW
jgi:hypothetical protein